MRNYEDSKSCRLCRQILPTASFPKARNFCIDCSDKFDNYGHRLCTKCDRYFTQEVFGKGQSVKELCPSCEKKSMYKVWFWTIILVPLFLYGCLVNLTEPKYSGPRDPSIPIHKYD